MHATFECNQSRQRRFDSRAAVSAVLFHMAGVCFEGTPAGGYQESKMLPSLLFTGPYWHSGRPFSRLEREAVFQPAGSWMKHAG